jgi:chromosome partitioning protein
MPVIAVMYQKGGVGKTTLATHLAKAFQMRGKEVLLVDSDPQGSARDWSMADPEQTLPVVGLDRPTLEKDIKPLLRNTDIVIIDGPPRHEQVVASAIKVADIVLMPVQPSPYDVWAGADLVKLLKERQNLLGTPKCAFVLSRVIKRTKIGGEVRSALDETEIPVFQNYTTQRVVYPNAAATGKTVFEAEPGGEAALEMMAIVDELEAFMAS